MAENQSTGNLPRVLIKRAFEDILVDEFKADYISDAFTTGVNDRVQVSIPEMSEDFVRLNLNSSKIQSTLTITFNIFSEVNETGVHELLYRIIKIPANHPLLSQFKLSELYPSSSFTSYDNEASEGHVSGQVVLTMKYLF
ncbi:hypothetical protein HN028_14280 [Pantoea ananatis]|uniref:hypothetical protein n=1 Tax=Pantoea ananas TaxID=553 RepID=UPI00352A883F